MKTRTLSSIFLIFLNFKQLIPEYSPIYRFWFQTAAYFFYSVASSEGKQVTGEAYFALHVSNMPHYFLTHGVPNTPQVKPKEDTCEAYFTQHVSNVTLCRCQIYSASANRKVTFPLNNCDTETIALMSMTSESRNVSQYQYLFYEK
jgi:hypothetical protein